MEGDMNNRINITLLPATAADAQALVVIQKKAFKRLYDIYHDEGNPYLRGADEIQRWLERPNCKVFKILANIAVYDGIIRGFAIMNYTFFDNAFIELLMVAEKYRHCGIGSALLNYLFAECKTQKLFTSTNKSNEPMRKLLGKAGFTFCGEIDALDEGDPEMFFFRKVAK